MIVMKKNATEAQIDHVIKWIESVGYQARPSAGVEQTIIGVVGDDRGKEQLKSAEHLAGGGKDRDSSSSRTNWPAASSRRGIPSSASAMWR